MSTRTHSKNCKKVDRNEPKIAPGATQKRFLEKNKANTNSNEPTEAIQCPL